MGFLTTLFCLYLNNSYIKKDYHIFTLIPKVISSRYYHGTPPPPYEEWRITYRCVVYLQVVRHDPSTVDTRDVDYRYQAAVPMPPIKETHGGEDVGLWAIGNCYVLVVFICWLIFIYLFIYLFIFLSPSFYHFSSLRASNILSFRSFTCFYHSLP